MNNAARIAVLEGMLNRMINPRLREVAALRAQIAALRGA